MMPSPTLRRHVADFVYRCGTIGVVAVALWMCRPAIADTLSAKEGRLIRQPNNVALLLDVGREYCKQYDETRAKIDANKAQQYLAKAVQLDPKNMAALAYRGVVRCIEADSQNSKPLAKLGLADIDAAVNGAPSNPEVRSLRGYVGVECPSEFNRLSQATSDLRMVEGWVKKDPSMVKRFELNLTKLNFKLGKCYRAAGDMTTARKYWTVAAANSSHRDGQSAARLLSKYR
jgi:tetratricopeptide (TPR) repeat protein